MTISLLLKILAVILFAIAAFLAAGLNPITLIAVGLALKTLGEIV